MDEKELELQETQALPEETLQEEELQEFSLEDIMKEFSSDGETPEEEPAEQVQERTLSGDTVRIEVPQSAAPEVNMEATIRLGDAANLGDTVRLGDLFQETEQEEVPLAETENTQTEPFSAQWEPEYEQPIGEYVPPQPIIFQPRSRLRELKRKLVTGPEKRYYELNERGLGKLQAAIFFGALVVLFCVGATALYALGMVPEDRMKLMVFGQFFAMMLSALLGSYQLIDGITDMFRGRFCLNSMLAITFVVCCADSVFCLQELRVPCCAAFSLQMTMSLWSTYHRRNTEMGMMDTMRKANHLESIMPVADYYEDSTGLVRGQGEVEDFMDHYDAPSGPEKVLNAYALAALGMSIAISVVAGVLHRSLSFAVQVLSVSLLAAVPVTSFITLTRPMAVLEKRLHKLGAVLCGWQGVKQMSRRSVFPMDHEDLFPIGTCKLNGVKYYGKRDPDEVVAYCTAVVIAGGGALVPLFEYLLSSRNGRHYTAHKLQAYGNGGIGGEVCCEPVLIGTPAFLKEMGVEIPEGTSVDQAVYAAIDGELCGVFAVTYNRARSTAAGLNTLCSYRSLRPMFTGEDFMLTESFIGDRFRINTRRFLFPDMQVRQELREKAPQEDAVAAALITTDGLAPFAFAVTGAKSLRTASVLGTVIHMLGGIVGLLMMLALAILGAAELLTPANMFLYELVWLIPGMLITEWTRSI